MKMPNVEWTSMNSPRPHSLIHLTTHKQHHHFLQKCLNEAQYEVGIVSPYIAFESKEWIDLFVKTVQRGIRIRIFTDVIKNQYDGFKSFFNELQNLNQLDVISLKRIHNKTLWMDQKRIVQGSYNWLSAVRNEMSDYHCLESSFGYEGPSAPHFIQNIQRSLKEKERE